jgi:hypothetical protein
MKIVGALFGFLILAVVFVVWFRAYKSIKGDESLLLPNAKTAKQTNSLDEFIAQYKRGEVSLDKSPVTGGNSAGNAAAKEGTSNATTQARTPAPAALATSTTSRTVTAGTAPAVKHDAFVSGATKLVYLACKAGLRDHHVFAHVQLSALAGGAMDPTLATSGIDLLICNAALSAVAAVDIIDTGAGPATPVKSDYLKGLGIRYLRLSAKSVPRPQEWHALLYKM